MTNETELDRGYTGQRSYPDFHDNFQECIELYVPMSLLIWLSIKSNFSVFFFFEDDDDSVSLVFWKFPY